MRLVVLILVAFGLIACGASPTPSVQSAKPPTPVIPKVPGASTPTPSPTATPIATPTPSATPIATPTPTPTATPSPTLVCYSNAGLFCTGGNLGSNLVQLNLNLMFIGPTNPNGEVIVSASVTNNNNATNTAICTQPNGPGCFANSACVSVVIMAGTGTFPEMLCGNIVTNQNVLGDL